MTGKFNPDPNGMLAMERQYPLPLCHMLILLLCRKLQRLESEENA